MRKKHLFLFSIISVAVIGLLCYFLLQRQKNNLPIINIVYKLGIRPDLKEPCFILYSHDNLTDTLKAGIKTRGGFSRKYPKKSYTVKFGRKMDFCGLPMDKDFILHANYIDKTFMRNKLCYDLFRQMSPKNVAAQCTYANVSLNNEPNGLYVVMQKIDRSMLKLNKNDSMSMLFKDPMILYKERISSSESNYYEQKYPDFDIADKTRYIEQFKDFLFHSNDSVFQKDITKWVDIENVIDWFLLERFSDNNDGILKNFYLYKIDSQTPFRIAVWDFDHSFGRDYQNNLNMMNELLNWQRSILFSRLMSFSEYRLQTKNRWFQLRSNVFTVDNMKRMIEENDKIISREIRKNCKKWSYTDEFYTDSNDYEAEIQLIFDYLDLYLPYLDRFFHDL